jgi:type III pantothenate kinase
MILVFDVGNSETTIGLFNSSVLRANWRIMTGVSRTGDELGVLIRALIERDGFDPNSVDGVAIGSVVPAMTAPLRDACTRFLPGSTALVIDAGSNLPIRLDVDEPMTVGADRILNTLAASQLFARDAIVVDLGTATTFDCITADGVFFGGVIAPGVQTSADTLVRRTSKLPATELTVPASVIGRRTEDCIRAGVMFGAAESIDGIVRRIKAEWPRKGEVPMVIATGGLAETLAAQCTTIDRVEPFLTLQGLQIAHAHLTGG